MVRESFCLAGEALGVVREALSFTREYLSVVHECLYVVHECLYVVRACLCVAGESFCVTGECLCVVRACLCVAGESFYFGHQSFYLADGALSFTCEFFCRMNEFLAVKIVVFNAVGFGDIDQGGPLEGLDGAIVVVAGEADGSLHGSSLDRQGVGVVHCCLGEDQQFPGVAAPRCPA